jgi:hypothetical protein
VNPGGGQEEYNADEVRSDFDKNSGAGSDLDMAKAKTAPPLGPRKHSYGHGMPGGYEEFNYNEAWERQKEDRRIESHVTKVGQCSTVTMRGEYMKKPKQVRDEHELDEMFATWKSSSSDSDSSDSSDDKKK